MAVATGIGSMPGVDIAESLKVVIDKLPDLPYLPELPDRGVTSAMVGRTLGMIDDLGFDLQPAGWRLTDAPGVDHRRAASRLAQDLDVAEELLHGYVGDFKVQLVGPWTLAAMVERPRGDRLLADVGARRELAQALAEAAGRQVAGLRRRIPGADLIVQVDEPALPAVISGSIPTASGFHRHRSLTPAPAREALTWLYDAIADAGATAVTHCCASDAPVGLLRQAGSAVSVDVSLLGAAQYEELALALEERQRTYLGVGPTPIREPWHPKALIDSTDRLLDMLGFDAEEVSPYLVLTPACGLSGAVGVSVASSLGAIHSAAQDVGA